MKNIKRSKDWLKHLQEHPELAEELINEAESQELCAVKDEYEDVIFSYNRIWFMLHDLVSELTKLQEGIEARMNPRNKGKKTETLNAAYGEKWNGLSSDFEIVYSKRLKTYSKKFENVKTKFNELRALVLPPESH